MKLAVICALFAEAKPLIHYYQLRKKEGYYPFIIYENETISLIITGIGPYHVSSAMSYVSALWQNEALSFLNVGIAGHKDLEVGTLCTASQVTCYSSKKTFYPALILDTQAKLEPLYTMEKPTKDYFDQALFDMEAYEFFIAGMRFASIEHLMTLKIVSDNEKHPIDNISASFVSSIIDQHVETIDNIINRLIELKTPLIPALDTTFLYNTITFSHTEKIMLEKLAQRFQVLYPGKDLPLLDLKRKKTAAAVLQSLETILIESPLELL